MLHRCHASTREINQRTIYVPLGEIEQAALARIFQVRLQIVKTDALLRMRRLERECVTSGSIEASIQGTDLATAPEVATARAGGGEKNVDVRDIDPRTIRPGLIGEFNGGGGSSKRIVRVMNLGTNHYQVHLPRAPPDFEGES